MGSMVYTKIVSALRCKQYCRSGNIREVLIIYANFAMMTNSRIRESREFFFFIKALLEKNNNSRILIFVKSPKIRNSQKLKHAKTTRSTVIRDEPGWSSREQNHLGELFSYCADVLYVHEALDRFVSI